MGLVTYPAYLTLKAGDEFPLTRRALNRFPCPLFRHLEEPGRCQPIHYCVASKSS